MSTETLYPHIETPEGQPARLRRTPKVRVAQIAMDYLAYGWSVDEMCRQHPYLTPAEAHTAMAYYFDHQAEVDAEIEAEWEEAKNQHAQLPPSRLLSRLRLSRGRP